jgi:NADP-dependent alcohol dehydrogenase
MTVKTSATLQDRFAESILQTLQEIAPKMMEEEFNYDAAANFMWSCTMALNGLIQKGVVSDWAVHGLDTNLQHNLG